MRAQIDLLTVSRHPLDWPIGWPRSSSYEHSRFGDHSMTRARVAVMTELERMGVSDLGNDRWRRSRWNHRRCSCAPSVWP